MAEVCWRLRLWHCTSHLDFRANFVVTDASVFLQNYWFQGSQYTTSDVDVRFLTTPNTFCIVAFSRPTNGQLIIDKRLPILPQDKIFLLSPQVADRSQSSAMQGLPWTIDETTGQLTVNVSESYLNEVEYAWAFEVRYDLDGGV